MGRELPKACWPQKWVKTGYFDGNGGEEPGYPGLPRLVPFEQLTAFL